MDPRTPKGVHFVPTARCPTCHTMLDATADRVGGRGPRPGDLTVCAYCVGINVFTTTMMLRAARIEELEALEPDQQDALATAIATITKHLSQHRRH